MNGHRFSLFQRRVGRDVRAWPMLALLLLVVLVAIGCVLWFMREAMRNERMAVREKLAEAYRGHLSLVQAQAEERWNHRLGRLDSAEPDAARFARCVREGLADSVICFDEQGRVAYPRLPATERSVAANAELLTLERLTDKTDPRFKETAARLRDRVTNYAADTLPSAQRRFLMHELKRLDPTVEFPTLAAEELAARYLEANPVFPTETTLRATELRDVWAVASPNRRVLALFTTAGLRAKLDDLIRDPSLPKGVRVAVIAPGEDAMTESTLVTASLGPELSGWRLSLSLDDRTLFDTEADQRVARYLAIGSVVIAAMAVLAIFIARGFRTTGGTGAVEERSGGQCIARTQNAAHRHARHRGYLAGCGTVRRENDARIPGVARHGECAAEPIDREFSHVLASGAEQIQIRIREDPPATGRGGRGGGSGRARSRARLHL